MRINYPRSERDGVMRFVPSGRQFLALIGMGFGVLLLVFLVLYALVKVPTPNEFSTAQATVVTYADGKTEIARVADANRTSIPLSDVPLVVQREVLAAEDRDFYEHGGFSASGIARAAWNNIIGGSTQGGSTITQQYAKNAYLTQDRTLTRKAKELVLSIKLSQTRSKERILEDYLNTIYFGRGAYGIKAASQAYFKIPASKLTGTQGAVLASLIRSPAGYAPETNKDRLRGRWNYVLDAMVAKDWITEKSRARQKFPKIAKRGSGNRLEGDNGFLVDMARRELSALGFSEEEVARGGYRITTTFDQKAMNAARTAVEEKGPKTGVKGLRIGIAAVRPGTGAVLAIYGGDDYLTDQFNNATQGIVQAGSTFKPFALAAALENDISLYDRFSGVNGTTFTFPGFAPYRVNNFDGYNAGGSISLLRATQSSVNTAYVDLENEITPEAVVDSAIRAGIPGTTAGLNAGPTTVLGTSSPHTLDMAAAYATFAARGLQANPYVIASVRNANGGLLYSKRPEVSRAFDADIASQVTYALTQVVKNGSGFAAQDLGRPAAGKTGTTNSNLSAWFVGYTPEIAVAVSMAKSTESGGLKTLRGTGGMTRVTGGSFPARMWTAMVKAFLKDTPVQQFDGTTFNSGGYSGGGSSSPKSTKSPTATSTTKPTGAPTTKAPTPVPTVPPATSPPSTP